MTQDEIIEMAKTVRSSGYWDAFDLINFAKLVAAKEREACAKECDEWAGMLFGHGDKSGADIAVSLRDTIRARGEA